MAKHLQPSWSLNTLPLSFNRHLSYDVCPQVKEEVIRTVLCCIVY